MNRFEVAAQHSTDARNWLRAPIAKRFGSVLLATSISQAISAAAIIAIPILLNAEWADTYALGLQSATATLGGVVIGIIYNLAIGRPWLSRWGLYAAGAATFSLAVSGVSTLMVASTDAGRAFGPQQAACLGAFAFGGAGLSIAGACGVRLACDGRPRFLASSTIPSNLALLLSLFMGRLVSWETYYLPALLWAVGAWANAGWLVLRQRALSLPRRLEYRDDSPSGFWVHAVGLAIGSLTSTILPSIYLIGVMKLAPGLAALAFTAGRIVTAVVGLFVNSLLLALYSWTQRPAELGRYSRIPQVVALGSGCLGLLLRGIGLGGPASYVPVILMLLALLVGAAVVLREMNAGLKGVSLLWKSVVDLAVSYSLATYFVAQPSLTGYFGVFAVSQSITLLVGEHALRRPAGVVLAIGALIVSVIFIFQGW